MPFVNGTWVNGPGENYPPSGPPPPGPPAPPNGGGNQNQPMPDAYGSCHPMETISISYPAQQNLETPLVLDALKNPSTSCGVDVAPFNAWVQNVQEWKDPNEIKNPDSKCLTACNLRAAERHKQCRELIKKFQFDMKQAGCPGTTCKLPSFTRNCHKPSPKKKTTKKKKSCGCKK